MLVSVKNVKRFYMSSLCLWQSKEMEAGRPTMLRCSLLIFLSGLLCCLSLVVAVNAEAGAIKRIVCPDGETFYLNEQETIETAGLAAANTDRIVIEMRNYRLTLYRDGQVLKKYTVAIGKPSTPTPIGEWKIIHKGGNWGGGFGARWLGINAPWGIYGIHGTDKPGSIGWRSSHGCVRLQNRNVVELYNLVRVGTPVQIIGDLPPVKLRKIYKLKAVGQDVVGLQFALRKKGFDPGPADARYGPAMEMAVRKMQLYYGLELTGIVASNEQYLLGLK
jgi:hypothetical protein